MKFGNFELDTRRRQLLHQGKTVALQAQLLKLLALLLEHPGEIVSRQRIGLALWDGAELDHEHRINTAVRKLRRALNHYASKDEVCILTSAGQGYQLVLPKQRSLNEVAPDKAGYDAFLTGRFLFSQRNPSALLAAKGLFELACERNPEFSLAHASLSRTCRFLTIFEIGQPGPLWEQAEKHAHLAVQLDPQLSEASSAVACVLARFRWQWEEGCAAYEQALRLNPDDAETLCDYGVTLLAMGCVDEGVERLDRVLTLDPRYAVGRATAALGWLLQGRKEEAMTLLYGMVEAMPGFLTAWIYLGIEQLNTEQWAAAEHSCRRMLSLAPENPVFLALLAHSQAGLGLCDALQKNLRRLDELARLRYVSPTAQAISAVAANDASSARDAVKRAALQRDTNFALYRSMKLFQPLRATPEFINTLSAMRLAV